MFGGKNKVRVRLGDVCKELKCSLRKWEKRVVLREIGMNE